jgi:WD40 repeat protein
VSSADFSPDGKRVVTGSHDGNVKIWDAEAGKELLTLKGHTDEVTNVSFSHTGRYILTAARDGGAILWPTVEW